MNDIEIADLLDGAANEIDKHGHAKGVLQDHKGGMCLRGAVLKAITDDASQLGALLSGGLDIDVAAAVADHLGLPRSRYADWMNDREQRAMAAVRWNNAEARTAAEVTSAMRETAASLRLAQVESVDLTPISTTEPVSV